MMQRMRTSVAHRCRVGALLQAGFATQVTPGRCFRQHPTCNDAYTHTVQAASWAERIQHIQDVASLGGGQARIDKQHAKGKLTARERLAALLDDGSFLEAGALVQHRCTDFGMESETYYGALLKVLTQGLILSQVTGS